MEDITPNAIPGSERDERLKKLAVIKEKGLDPYPAKSCRNISVSEVLSDFSELNRTQKEFVVAGRLRTLRAHGNLTFAHLQDGKDQIQIAISRKEVGDGTYKLFTKLIDMGDFVEFRGVCFLTHKGENSVMAHEWTLLTKALRPLPEKWHGLSDGEEKLRRRYLDIMLNREVYEMIEKRSKFWQATRNFLNDHGFLEVETPVLETMTGGADAKPFLTHHNALDIDVYLRISMGELWQKKLMVAGFPKTFEIGRQFRNEGMDAEHLQDYSQMEFYWAYANYEQGMELTKELYKYIAQEAFGTMKFTIKGFEVDLSQKWERYDYMETVQKFTSIDVLHTNETEIIAKLKELGVKYDEKGFNITRAIDNLWKYCRKQIAGPGFLINPPVAISPLAKRNETNPQITQRFQVILAGSELGNGYSELNDPIDQEGRFMEQQKLREAGDDEAQMHDHDFVEALEYGMPPTCGFGFSERLFSFLMNKTSRECQIFPLMKPKNE
ncbi:lysine--tRNA ligase [Candidatus Falkowbacteria bacterium CG10_big_fil_rev_8_21_14_0_10_39_9]|uniref:Lysine--tRNA ligase n=1 Tax=Candidatus Falkowbacteria bacterium CG10_big_fil_rev_8_21_14_0_10_39_9 TaxID=1974566 RepID=A0A2M6WQ63_9BACT|nr:MAG: lysine--tRNA ligase [Candidatus Falkowbacteria bacterium CG10_big_fil_rev_8_21_14_0_10_39_9]